jgi:hypothetical protein
MILSTREKILAGIGILFLILFCVQTCRVAQLKRDCSRVVGVDTTKKVTVKPNTTTDTFTGKPTETTTNPTKPPATRWGTKPVIPTAPTASKNCDTLKVQYDQLKWRYDSVTGLFYMALGDIDQLKEFYTQKRTFYQKYDLKGKRGFIAVWDTLSGNDFVNRRIEDSIVCYDTLTETTITRTIERNAFQVYLGLGVSGSEQDLFRLVQAEILFKGSRGGGIGITATKDLNNMMPMQYGVKKLWLISFRKKKQ